MTVVARPLHHGEREAFAAARLYAVHSLMPYLATALFRLEPWAAEGLGTFGVDDRWRVYLDPARLAAWGVRATAGVLLHEVGHALRDHAGQAGALGSDVDRWAWNLCGDAAINDDLVAAGVELPGAPVLPSTLRGRDGRPLPTGWTALQYYDALPVEEVSVVDASDDRPPGVAGDLGSVVRVARRPGNPGASCGRVAGGVAHDVTAPGEGVSPAAQALTRRATATAVRDAARRRASTVPLGLRRWADVELAPPQVPWQQVLRGALRRGLASAAGALDTTYARPSRRRVPGVILPGTRRPVPSVAVVVDTSGSMDEQALRAVLAEVEALARQVGASGQRLRVLTVDAAVHEVQDVRRAADVVLRGGGGTDLTPGLLAAATGRPRPDIVVVCTDGHTPWPARAPSTARWLVVQITSAGAPAWLGDPPPSPDWADVVEIEGVAA